VPIDAFKREKNVKHKPYMDKLLIMPNKVNPLHLYAYYNDTSLMAEALKSGCNFINTRLENLLLQSVLEEIQESA
jgi:hypothetical protein